LAGGFEDRSDVAFGDREGRPARIRRRRITCRQIPPARLNEVKKG